MTTPSAALHTSDRDARLSDVPVITIGHSHLVAILHADQQRKERGRSCLVDIRFVQLLNPRFQPHFHRTDEGDFVFHPRIEEQIRAASNGAQRVFDCISGNEYHSIGLVRHPQPFDFVLPQARDLPLEKSAQIIPIALVRESLRSVMGDAIGMLEALKATTDLPISHIQSPPPISSEQYIGSHPAGFKEQIEAQGVAAASLRYKLWLLQSAIFQSECERIGIDFLPCPTASLTDDGFLRQEGWNLDPTHANSWYGDLVIDQMEQTARLNRRRKRA